MTADASRQPAKAAEPPDSPMKSTVLKVLLVQVATLAALFLFEFYFTR